MEYGAANIQETFLPPPPEAPPLEEILTGLTTALMCVPLAAIFTSALLKISDGNLHQALWEKYGMQDLKCENLLIDRSVVARRVLGAPKESKKKNATDNYDV